MTNTRVHPLPGDDDHPGAARLMADIMAEIAAAVREDRTLQQGWATAADAIHDDPTRPVFIAVGPWPPHRLEPDPNTGMVHLPPGPTWGIAAPIR